MQCVILAGGLGTRMRRWTATIPKSLIPVAGRPFIEWQLEWLAANGIGDVVVALGYLGSLISDYVEDGSRWSVHVSYVSEGDALLGTAGALRLVADRGALEPTSLVLYGDSYLPIEVGPVMKAFGDSRLPVMMTVWRNDGLYQGSNAELQGGNVIRYDKSGGNAHGMCYVDYGLWVISRDVLIAAIPSGRCRDLGDFFASLSRADRLAGFEVHERFYEIGSEDGLRDLEVHLRGRNGS